MEIVGGGVGLKCPKYRILDILGAFLSKLEFQGSNTAKGGQVESSQGVSCVESWQAEGRTLTLRAVSSLS